MNETITDWKKDLKQMYLQDVERRSPDFFRASGGYDSKLAPRYSDATANGLTRCVIDWIKFHGGDAQRINTTGTMRKVGGQMKWTKSGMRRGTADIHAIIQGRAVSIEIKIGKDKMSEDQHREKERIERAGGLYCIVRNMPEFISWYEDHFGEKKGFTGKYVSPKVYDELEELTGYDRGTIKNFKSIAERTSSSRNDDLSFKHHQQVAPLEPEQQKKFLQKASDEKLF